MGGAATSERFNRVMTRAAELSDLESANALVGWDQETFMPAKGVDGRADVSATIAGLQHERLTDPRLREDLEALSRDGDGLDTYQRGQVIELKRLHDRAAKVPADLVRAVAEAQSRGSSIWAAAKAKKEFAAFSPTLAEIFKLKRAVADAVGYREEPYEALLDEFEPGAKVSEVAKTLHDVRDFLIPLVKEIAGSSKKPNTKILAGPYDLEKQDLFGREVVTAMGFDLEAGRLDVSNHPFTSGIHSGDTRLTTRYKQDLSVGLFGTMHEAGHGLYEQNLPAATRRTPLGVYTSLGIHESQSRLWENNVGRGRPFWTKQYPRLQELFPEHLAGVSFDEYYRAINAVEPSFIRIEADEVTYNLHIVLRFELERDVLTGKVAVKDLPEAWNARFRDYLGLTPPSPDLGVMQDIHWAVGLVGYFPTYTLGTLYAAQFFAGAKKAIPDLEERIAKGDLLTLRDWLVENVHRHGRRYAPAALVEKATGMPVSAEHFNRYLRSKFAPLYGLAN